MVKGFAATPEPPYWAVIFTAQRTPEDDNGYNQTAGEVLDLARRQPGYLGMESVGDTTGLGITVSFWREPEDIALRKAQADHATAQRLGREKWYQAYSIRVTKVERASVWQR